jgi:hypothetical protein
MRRDGDGFRQHKTNTTMLPDGPLTRFQHGRNGISRYEAARLLVWRCLVLS